jgi:hypothetical protein
MLYREIIAVCSEIHTKHINMRCGQNVEFLCVKYVGTYSNNWALNGHVKRTYSTITRYDPSGNISYRDLTG